MIPTQPIVIDQEAQQKVNGKSVDFEWKVTFKQTFAITHALTRDEFVALANEQFDWLKQNFLNQMQGYPRALAGELDKHGCLRRETFQDRKE